MRRLRRPLLLLPPPLLRALKVELVARLPFHAAAESTEATQRLIDNIKMYMADTLALCDVPCVDGLDGVHWVRGRERPLQKCFAEGRGSQPIHNRRSDPCHRRFLFADASLHFGRRRLQAHRFCASAAFTNWTFRSRGPNKRLPQASKLRRCQWNAIYGLPAGV